LVVCIGCSILRAGQYRPTYVCKEYPQLLFREYPHPLFRKYPLLLFWKDLLAFISRYFRNSNAYKRLTTALKCLRPKEPSTLAGLEPEIFWPGYGRYDRYDIL
jgi:hypothetical protein